MWRRGAVSLALGVATTLAITWPIALASLHFGWTVHALQSQGGRAWTDASGEPYKLSRSSRLLGEWWQVYRPASSDSVLPLGEKRLLPGWVATPSRPPAGEKAENVTSVDTAAHGWPWRCMASESWTIKTQTLHRSGSAVGYREVLRGNLVLGSTSNGRTIMPLRPMWLGLIGNIAVWGAAWFAAFTGLSVLRGMARKRRGACVGCGYDRRGLQPTERCPECGRGA